MDTLLFYIGVGVVIYALFTDLVKIGRWAPVRWFFEGLFGGLGVRSSGLFRQRRGRRIIGSARDRRGSGEAGPDGDGQRTAPSGRTATRFDDDGQGPPRRRTSRPSPAASSPSGAAGSEQTLARVPLNPAPPPSDEAALRASLARSDAVSALVNLGYKRRDARAAAKSAQAALDQGAPVAAIIRYALALLSRGSAAA